MFEANTGTAPHLLRLVERRSALAVSLLVLALIAGLGWIDYETGWEWSFSIFYMVPVALGSWRFGTTAAALLSVLCGIAWFAADQLAGHVYSHELIPYWNASVRTGMFLALGLTLAALRGTLRHAHRLARIDVLTGVPNLRAFREHLTYHLEVVTRHRDPVSVATIDLDRFKEVNDTYGHAIGDEALRIVAHVLTHNIRKVDLTARVGGDEFAVLLPRTGANGARDALEKVRAAIEDVMSDRGWPITASIGAATCHGRFAAEECLRVSDRMLYQAKAEGGNRVVVELLGAHSEESPHLARAR